MFTEAENAANQKQKSQNEKKLNGASIRDGFVPFTSDTLHLEHRDKPRTKDTATSFKHERSCVINGTCCHHTRKQRKTSPAVIAYVRSRQMTLVVMPILVLLWASLANSSVVKLLMKERCIPRSAPQIFHFARSRTDNLLLAQSQHCNKHFGVFGWQIEMIFRQLLKGWFSPTLAITRETMTHRKFSKRIYEKNSIYVLFAPENLKIERVEQAPYSDQPTATERAAERYCSLHL